MSAQCPCPTCRRRLFWWPTVADWARYVLRSGVAAGLLTLGEGFGAATMARVALDARQAVLDERTRLHACRGLVDEAVGLTLDATLLARTVGRPRAEPLMYTVDAVPSVVRATPP